MYPQLRKSIYNNNYQNNQNNQNTFSRKNQIFFNNQNNNNSNNKNKSNLKYANLEIQAFLITEVTKIFQQKICNSKLS